MPTPEAPTATPIPAGPAVTIGDTAFEAEVAHTPALRSRGLSGRDGLAPQTGMLFVYEGGKAGSFWMKGMRFALDFVWISSDCEVVGLTVDVPPPSSNTGDSDLPKHRSPAPAAYVFEVNAGEVAAYSIAVGDSVRFSGIAVEGADC